MQKLDADGECNAEVMGVVVQETRGGCGGGGCVVGCRAMWGWGVQGA